MGNTVAQASTGLVNAVSPTTTNADTGAGESELPARAPKGPQFENAFDKTLYELNQKYGGGDDPEFKSLAKITEEVQAKAPENQAHRQPAQQPKKSIPVPSQPQNDPTKAPSDLKRYKVDGKIVELTSEQAERMVQKGLYLDKKNADIANTQRQLESAIGNFNQAQEKFKADVQSFLQDPTGFYERIAGPERARQVFEPYVGKHVVREIEYEKNPAQRAIDEANLRAQRAEMALQQQQQQLQQFQVQQQSGQLQNEYKNLIIQALEKTQNEWMKNDMTAGAVAHWMKRGLERNIQYTPEQLVQLVKEDYATCAKATTASLAQEITKAKAANDLMRVVKLGEELVDLLGRDVMYAIGKYHLAKMTRQQPTLPKQPMETARNQQAQTTESKKPYMKWEEWQDARRQRALALERGENVPDW